MSGCFLQIFHAYTVYCVAILKDAMMPESVELPDELVEQARRHGEASQRSIPEQIVHWSTIGRLAEENPDLPYGFIKDILLALQEEAEGRFTPYVFGK